MLIIQKLSNMIKEEIKDAEKYANCALKYKEEDKALSETFYTLASEELQHMDRIHVQVIRIINEYKAKNGDPPALMQAVYDYLHGEWVENVKEVKILLGMYKG